MTHAGNRGEEEERELPAASALRPTRNMLTGTIIELLIFMLMMLSVCRQLGPKQTTLFMPVIIYGTRRRISPPPPGESDICGDFLSLSPDGEESVK